MVGGIVVGAWVAIGRSLRSGSGAGTEPIAPCYESVSEYSPLSSMLVEGQ